MGCKAIGARDGLIIMGEVEVMGELFTVAGSIAVGVAAHCHIHESVRTNQV